MIMRSRSRVEEGSHAPIGSYSPEELAMLSRVLDRSLKAVVELSGATLTEEEVQALSSGPGKVIMDHFTAGETDPEVLKKIAMESVLRR
jgi:hypothetical protein